MINMLQSTLTSQKTAIPEKGEWIKVNARGELMKEYDVVIIGSGAGANLIEDALEHNKSLALVDKGPLGGTCLNTG